MLIFNSPKSEYRGLHEGIVRYLHFLAEKSKAAELTDGQIKSWYVFRETKENWLGYALRGNNGSALGMEFAKFFADKIGFVLTTHDISRSVHIEKAMLLYDKTGRDRLSDFTANLIKGYLAKYTEEFAKKYIDKKFCDSFYVERSNFNYLTESFESGKYYLPYIIKKGKREYVLLTPSDILQEDEAAISKKDLFNNYNKVRASIDNDVLRAQVENYICIAVREYERRHKEEYKKITEAQYSKVEKAAFKNALAEFPELYDYYIKLKENEPEAIESAAISERMQVNKMFIGNVDKFVKYFKNNYSIECDLAVEEARERIKFFKNIIENGGLYRIFYVDNQFKITENALRRMFYLVWIRTIWLVRRRISVLVGWILL